MEDKRRTWFNVLESVSCSPMLFEKWTKSLSDLLKSVLDCKEITDCEDVLMEIAMGLPVKDILRLKCVSKQYCRMISDPLFGYLYWRHNPGTHFVVGLLLYHSGWPFSSRHNFVFFNDEPPKVAPKNPFRAFMRFDTNSGIHRMWSCNGLFCLWIAMHQRATCDFYICNPTTNKSIQLPNLVRPQSSRIVSMIIAFDPQRSPFYKVVCIWGHRQLYLFSVYSSESRVWRLTNEYLEAKPSDTYLFNKGAFWNKSLHWISRKGPFLRFDLDEECWKPMPTTQIPKGKTKRNIQYFGVSGGRLYLVELHNYDRSVLEVLEMQRDYSRWVLKYRFCLNGMFGLYPGDDLHFKFRIHLVVRMGSAIGLLLSASYGTMVISYYGNGVSTETLRLLYDGMNMYQFKWYRSHQFVTTLTAV